MMAFVAAPVSCPSCKTSLQFKTELALTMACPVCRTEVRRVQVPGATLKKVSPVREDMSIIKIGTTGNYHGSSFEVVGRIQYFFTEGYRNHWFVLYQNGSTGWLGEWAGNYSFFKESMYTSQKSLNHKAPGQKVDLGEVRLEIEVIDHVKHIYWEGEVMELGLQDQDYMSLELVDTVNNMGIIHLGAASKPHAYVGQYVDFTELQLQNVRQHHEWL